MKFGIVVFPGSNCDHDAYSAVKLLDGADAAYIWHKETKIPDGIDCVILPGGFSYGDYLRCGAIARFSPVMNEVISFAKRGGLVIGICNGFQVLIEAGLLPGALLRNKHLHFICKDIYLKTINNNTQFTSHIPKGKIIKIPVAHGEGNYFAEPDMVRQLEDEDRIAFKYCNDFGEINTNANPNGSVNNIAGILNENKNVLGMMPHPERYSDNSLGCNDGIDVFKSIFNEKMNVFM